MKTNLAVLAAMALPVAAYAQGIPSGPVRTPDERGHVKKMTEEMIQLSRAKKPEAKAELFTRYGEERLRELEKMQERGAYTHTQSLGTSYEGYAVRGFSGAIEIGASQGCDMSGALGRYAEATSKHTAVLQRVLANAPPAARKGLLNALQASLHGHEQAMLAHQRGKGKSGGARPGGAGGEDRPGAGKPGGVERPGGDDRPRGPGRPGGDERPGAQDGPGRPPGKGKPAGEGAGPHDGPPGKGRPEGEGGPGKGKPAKGKPEGEDAPGRGGEPKGPPPGKGKSEGDNGPHKGPGGPPPGKGNKEKGESPKGSHEGPEQGPPPGKGKGKGGS